MAPYDISVLPVWIKDRNFGDNIRILILDDDVDTTHPELKDSFVRIGMFDVQNSICFVECSDVADHAVYRIPN